MQCREKIIALLNLCCFLKTLNNRRNKILNIYYVLLCCVVVTLKGYFPPSNHGEASDSNLEQNLRNNLDSKILENYKIVKSNYPIGKFHGCLQDAFAANKSIFILAFQKI
jgi:hypothetical protein